MPRTREDAWSDYRRATNNVEEQKRLIRGYENQKSNLISEKNSINGNLDTYKNDKKNFEERLKQVKDIIKLFDGKVSSKISNAVNKANNAEDKHRKAVICRDISSNDVSVAFFTESVSQNNDSNNCYVSFQNEKVRLERKISDLKTAIKNAQNAIDSLNSQIRQINGNISNAKYYQKRYQSQADGYYREYRRL